MEKDTHQTNPIAPEGHFRLIYRQLDEAYERIEALEQVVRHQHQRLAKLEEAILERDTKPLPSS